MIRSMTGFAAVAADLPGVALSVELRSVTHRFLDLQLRLPDELRGLETTLRERILAELKRGKVECRITLGRPAAGAAGLAVDLARVAELVQAAADVARNAPGAVPLSAGEILRWPGVLAEPGAPRVSIWTTPRLSRPLPPVWRLSISNASTAPPCRWRMR